MKFSTRNKTFLYILASLLSVIVIAACAYFLLGGFKEVIVFETNNNVYSIAGRDFKGRISNDTLGIYFNEMKSIVDNGELNGDLCLINYLDSNLNNNEIHQFIGIIMEAKIAEIPSGLKVLEIESEFSFSAALIMHPLVRPNSEKVQALIYELAQSKGQELKDYSLEIFYRDNSVIVEMFGKGK